MFCMYCKISLLLTILLKIAFGTHVHSTGSPVPKRFGTKMCTVTPLAGTDSYRQWLTGKSNVLFKLPEYIPFWYLSIQTMTSTSKKDPPTIFASNAYGFILCLEEDCPFHV